MPVKHVMQTSGLVFVNFCFSKVHRTQTVAGDESSRIAIERNGPPPNHGTLPSTSPSSPIRRSEGAPSGIWLKTARDRKSTRLNSSHGYSSYAVFCLKKKKKKK